jgi:hypothetical protein
MQKFAAICAVVAGATFAAAGCGGNDGLLRTQGRVVKGGETFVPDEGTHLQIQFVPISDHGKPPENIYAAEVEPKTSVFRPWGAMKQGMPPGRYRVALELRNRKKKDLFEGKYDTGTSPYIFDIDEDTEEIVIDLDNPPPSSPADLAERGNLSVE